RAPADVDLVAEDQPGRDGEGDALERPVQVGLGEVQPLGRDDAEDEHELDPRQESGEGGQSPGHAAAEDEGDGGTADEELGGAEADEITDPLGEPAPGD